MRLKGIYTSLPILPFSIPLLGLQSIVRRTNHMKSYFEYSSPNTIIQWLTTIFRTNRQALRYIIRNLSLPARTRAQAQLELTQMHCYTRPTQIRNRCILGGKGRGILRDFKMSRVCALHMAQCYRMKEWRKDVSTMLIIYLLRQYNFRMNALSGDLPGVKKASW